MPQSVEEVGFERGRIYTLEEVAKNMIREGSMSKKQILMITGLDLTEINVLEKEIKREKSS
ncbi:hypothetical protein QUF76_17015 [Desulfobacterales bacterium HSG16]|nr:hypothetical protein [Desulfobacterales bacterium HSG16]